MACQIPKLFISQSGNFGISNNLTISCLHSSEKISAKISNSSFIISFNSCCISFFVNFLQIRSSHKSRVSNILIIDFLSFGISFPLCKIILLTELKSFLSLSNEFNVPVIACSYRGLASFVTSGCVPKFANIGILRVKKEHNPSMVCTRNRSGESSRHHFFSLSRSKTSLAKLIKYFSCSFSGLFFKRALSNIFKIFLRISLVALLVKVTAIISSGESTK